MERFSLYFTAPGQVSVRQEDLPPLAPNQVLVRSQLSAISPGTEMLAYRGQFPTDLPVDESIPALEGAFGYPLKYGYACVGRVIAAGDAIDPQWIDRRVFAFHPHESCFSAVPEELLPLPEDIAFEDAVFLPNMETAVNFVMDGSPVIGERVVVFGQGVVGLLTTALLAQFPLSALATLDHYPLRRQASLEFGAQASLAPEEIDALDELLPGDADLTYELSGSPPALDQALAITGFAGRVVIGSWYGQKQTHLNLGGRFHRSRIRLISSQVSSLAPEFGARWTKSRRFEVAWDMLRKVTPSRLITQLLPIQQAPEAYQLIDRHPEDTIQILLEYT
jgi:2-desacetyl-2-hydroxyethyl bacteriochlorophyllide A dehydrogenase